jgi:co-chaperonin GroES (HSP10)
MPVDWAPEDINDTGIEPVEFKCVVRLDPKEEVTSGGIFIPQERRDRNQMAATEGTLLACGGNAFTLPDWKGRKPELGDRVMISKYAGITREADPTDLIRVVHDKEILAVLT